MSRLEEDTPARPSLLLPSLLMGLLLVAPALAFRLRGLAPPCLLHSLTGLPCPGCGLGTALAALSHFEPWDALRSYPPLAALALLYSVLLVDCSTRLLGRHPGRTTARLTTAAALFASLGIIGNWAVRLIYTVGGFA